MGSPDLVTAFTSNHRPSPYCRQTSSSPLLIKPHQSKKFDLDLRDWIGCRVLARRDRFFCPGVIRNVYEGYSVSILFDAEEQPLVYHEVLAKAEIDTVIADAVPATSQVSTDLFSFAAMTVSCTCAGVTTSCCVQVDCDEAGVVFKCSWSVVHCADSLTLLPLSFKSRLSL